MDNTLGSVEHEGNGEVPWKVVVNKARGKHDMRRSRDKTCFGSCGVSCHHICNLERETCQGNLCSVEQFRGSWERVPVTVDSGAIDTVVPRRIAKGIMTRQTEASRNGLKYRSASGNAIVNEGEKTLKGYTNEANLVDMTAQVAEVTKPLGSVRAFVKAGNRVVFDNGGSYIQHKATGVKTVIEDRNGAYVFDLWIPRDNAQSVSGKHGYSGKYWGALAEQEDNGNEGNDVGFAGLDDLM